MSSTNNPPIVLVDGEYCPTVGVLTTSGDGRFSMDLYFEPPSLSPGRYDVSAALLSYSDIDSPLVGISYVPGDPIPDDDPETNPEEPVRVDDEGTDTEATTEPVSGLLMLPDPSFEGLFDDPDTFSATVPDGIHYPDAEEEDDGALPAHVRWRSEFTLTVVRTDGEGNGLATFDAGRFRGAVLVSGYGGCRATVDEWSRTPSGIPDPDGVISLYEIAVGGRDYRGDGSIGFRTPVVLNSLDVAAADLRLVFYDGDEWTALDTRLVEEVTTSSAFHVAYVQARLPSPGPVAVVDATVWEPEDDDGVTDDPGSGEEDAFESGEGGD